MTPARAAFFLALLLFALPCQAAWPPRLAFGQGWQLAPSVSWQYQGLQADLPGADLHFEGFRRQRSARTLTAPDGTSLKLDYDFTTGTWADLMLRVGLGRFGSLRLGQVKPPIGLELLTSHRALAHFERSPAAVLLPGRRLAAAWTLTSDRGTTALALIGDNVDGLGRGHGLFARSTRQFGSAPDRTRWHLGLGAGVEWPDQPLRLRGRPEVSGLPLVLADSGLLPDARRVARAALEAAWDRGPVSVQAEHIELRASTAGPACHRARGGYLALSWRPAGEARRYRDGVFDTLEPSREWGAVELVARASTLRLPRPNGDHQRGHSYSLGANWHITRSLRLMAHFGAAEGDGDPVGDIHGLRLHYQF